MEIELIMMSSIGAGGTSSMISPKICTSSVAGKEDCSSSSNASSSNLTNSFSGKFPKFQFSVTPAFCGKVGIKSFSIT